MKKTCKSFLSDPVPFNGQGYEKQKGLELVTSRSSSCKKQVQKNSFTCNVFPDQGWWCILSYSKNYIRKKRKRWGKITKIVFEGLSFGEKKTNKQTKKQRTHSRSFLSAIRLKIAFRRSVVLLLLSFLNNMKFIKLFRVCVCLANTS